MGSLTNMQGLAPQAPDPIAGLQSRLLAAHTQARAMFDKTGELVGRADRARQGLVALTALGDTIQPDDVIREAGKLVAGGEDPLAMAGLLADMPADGKGDALAGWVAMHAKKMTATEAQVAQAHQAAKHALGVSALHVLQAHSRGSQTAGVAQPTAQALGTDQTANPLAPTGGTP